MEKLDVLRKALLFSPLFRILILKYVAFYMYPYKVIVKDSKSIGIFIVKQSQFLKPKLVEKIFYGLQDILENIFLITRSWLFYL